MASGHGDQSPTKDVNDTSSLISEEDSGLGSLASPEEENARHVGTNVDFEEETLASPVEVVADNANSRAMRQESYDREILRLERKKASKLTLKGIYGRSVSVSECTFETSTQGTTSDDARSVYEVEASVPNPAERTLSYSHGQDVLKDVLENLRSRGDGKFEDCYILPVENGLLISPIEITTFTENIPGAIVRVEQAPRRGTSKVFTDVSMEAKVSQNRNITYKRGQQDCGGNFLLLEKLGYGNDGIVYKAMDVRTGDNFAVKGVKINVIHEKMKYGEDPLSSFLKLTGCEQTCSAYGVIVDEADNCVYFLMELLEGKTLMNLLGGKTAPIGIPLAVDYTIDILKGLQYIHSKGMVHTDIVEVNVMIVGPKAIIIDTTGARKASSHNSRGYLRDVENAIELLNNMLHNNTDFSPPPWKASDQDRKKFNKNKNTLKKLEHLLKRQAEYLASKSPTIDTIDTLLKELQEISGELKGLLPPPDSPQSSEDEADSLKLECAEKQKRLEEQDKLLEEHKQLLKRVNKDRDELKAKNKSLTEERDTFKAEAQKANDQHEQKIKDLQDQLEALKAQMQGTAGQDEGPES